MAEMSEVRQIADAVLAMIREDQASGQVPREVSSLDELDECVDIDDYYRRMQLSGDPDAAQLRAAVETEIGRHLEAGCGGPWHVFWKPQRTAAVDVGRTAGYASQDEAATVGREHVHLHGGGFHLHRAD